MKVKFRKINVKKRFLHFQETFFNIFTPIMSLRINEKRRHIPVRGLLFKILQLNNDKKN